MHSRRIHKWFHCMRNHQQFIHSWWWKRCASSSLLILTLSPSYVPKYNIFISFYLVSVSYSRLICSPYESDLMKRVPFAPFVKLKRKKKPSYCFTFTAHESVSKYKCRNKAISDIFSLLDAAVCSVGVTYSISTVVCQPWHTTGSFIIHCRHQVEPEEPYG